MGTRSPRPSRRCSREYVAWTGSWLVVATLTGQRALIAVRLGTTCSVSENGHGGGHRYRVFASPDELGDEQARVGSRAVVTTVIKPRCDPCHARGGNQG